MLFTLILLTQLTWTNASIVEVLDRLNQIRQNVPGNKDILPISAYPKTTPENWERVKFFPNKPGGALREEIDKMHRVLTNAPLVPVFFEEIVITRHDNTIGKYGLSREIEDGSQSSVRLGCTTIGQVKKVAVKLINIGDEEVMEDAYREEKIYSEMKGVIDGIVVMIDSGTLEKDGYKFLVMIFDLFDADIFDLHVMCGGRFSLSTSITLIRRLLKILQDIHAFGIVHRDLKAENCMLLFPHGVHLIDFGYAQWYNLDPRQRKNKRQYANDGTPYTMSTFTHMKNDPHPRDDLLSLWYMLAVFIDSWLPWDELLAMIVPNMTRPELDKIMDLICDKKMETSLRLLSHYPDLNPFIEHVFNMEFEDNPNYGLLDKCLEIVLNKCFLNHNWLFDWEFKGDMLFCNPNLLYIAMEYDENEKSYTIQFEPFYASFLREFQENNYNVQILEELNQESRRQIELEMTIGTFVTEESQPLVMQSLSSSDFQNLGSVTLVEGGCLYAGFSYFCLDSGCHIVMVLRTNKDVWDNLSQFKLYAPYQHVTTEPQKLRDCIHFVSNNVLENPIDEYRYQCTALELANVPPNPISVLERVISKDVAAMIEKKEVAEIGMKLNTVNSSSGFVQQIHVVFRRSFDFVEYASHACHMSNLKLSWSVDESDMACNDSATSSADMGSSKQQGFIVPNAKTVVIWPTNIQSSNWKLARKAAVDEFLKNPTLDYELLNVRVQWMGDNGNYTFAFIQDAFHKTFLTEENPPNYKLGANWLLGSRIVEGDWNLRQLANTIASETEVRQDVGVEYRSGLVILSATAVLSPNAILELMSRLRSENFRKDADINPQTIGSVAFGYAVSGKYVYGVTIFETLGNTVLKLINQNRWLQPRVPQLGLSDQNNEWTRTTMTKYNKRGLFTKSGKLLRSSAHVEKTQVVIDESVTESRTSAKGKSASSPSTSRVRAISRQRSNSKTLLSYSSDSIDFNGENGESGAYKFDLPSSKEVSIPEYIELFWKQITPCAALINAGYKTISVAAFTGTKTIKIAYKLQEAAKNNLTSSRARKITI